MPLSYAGRALSRLWLLGVGAAVESLGLYLPQTIAAGTCPSLASDVANFGVTADLVTRAATPDSQVDALLQVMVRQKGALATAVPVLAGLDLTTPWPYGAPLPPHGAVAKVR